MADQFAVGYRARELVCQYLPSCLVRNLDPELLGYSQEKGA